MYRAGIGVTKCHEREVIRTHGEEGAGFLQNPHISGIKVWKLVVELYGIGEIHGRENVLEAGTGLKQHHGVLPTGGFYDVKDSDSME